MVKRVSKRVSEIVFLIAAGGSTYYLIEIWFRGFSHWTMFVLGGVALTFCSFQGEVMHWSEPMWIQIIRAVLFLTSLEFIQQSQIRHLDNHPETAVHFPGNNISSLHIELCKQYSLFRLPL